MKRTLNILTALTAVLMLTSCGTKQEVKQEPETAAEAVKNMTAGWCLGNDMDAFDTDIEPGSPLEAYETCWGQQPANELLFKKLAEKGFDAIRVPVTWWQHMDAEGRVDSLWMARVEQIVNWVLDNGMYCIVDAHHDTGAHVEAWLKADSACYASQHERYKVLWTQIANHFKDFDQHLLFEIGRAHV